jgi:hypothetical protein
MAGTHDNQKTMTTNKIMLLAATGWAIAAGELRAQDTNFYLLPPPTILEALENTSGQLIVKGTEPVGAVSAEGAVISVVCKEDTVVNYNHKEYGIMVQISINGQPDDRTIVDYDEMDSLLSSMDYLANINRSVTALSGFTASFTTKAGLRVSAFSSRRVGQIELALRSSRMTKGMVLTSDQLAQFHSLVDQAKHKLDALKKG